MSLKNNFRFANKIYFTAIFLLFFSAVPFQSSRCQFLKDQSKLCKIVNKISYPTNLLVRYINKTKTFFEIVRATGEIQDGQGISRFPYETKKRFKEFPPGFKFFFKKGTRPQSGYLILSGWNPNKKSNIESVQVWDINQQEKIHEYFYDRDLQKLLNENQFIPPFHALLNEDGSLVFHLEDNGSLVMIDKCSNLIKNSVIDKKLSLHHSISKDNKGKYYAPTRNKKFIRSKLENKFQNHGFSIFDENLNEIYNVSLIDIYKKNGLLNQIVSMESIPKNPFHLNDVEPYYRSDGKLIVLLSLRSQSSVMALDIETNKIIWVIDNVISKQHDVDILNSDNDLLTISIFDNNILMTDKKQVSKGNRVLIFDKLPTSPEEDIIFISTRQKHAKYGYKSIEFEWMQEQLRPKTITSGLSEFIKSNNSLMVEESNFGRIFEIDLNSNKTLWQYINKPKKNSTTFYLSWSRRLSKLPGGLNKQSFQECKSI